MNPGEWNTFLREMTDEQRDKLRFAHGLIIAEGLVLARHSFLGEVRVRHLDFESGYATDERGRSMEIRKLSHFRAAREALPTDELEVRAMVLDLIERSPR